MVVLGLDVSTNTIGYAFTENKKILDMGFIDISKQKTIKDKAYQALEMLDDNMHIDKTEKIIVEDSLSGFLRGRTSQQTIIKLAKFNAVLVYCLEFGFGEVVEGVHPMTARKKLFGKSREKGKPAKEFVKEQINSLYNLEKYIKLTKTGLWDKRNLDGYDALVCALYE